MGEVRSQNLQSDLATERKLLGQVNFGHGAASQPTEQSISTYITTGKVDVCRRFGGADGVGHIRWDVRQRLKVWMPVSAAMVALATAKAGQGTRPLSLFTTRIKQGFRRPQNLV